MKVRNMARERLEKGEMSLGVGIRTARTVDIAKMMKTAGYDWLFIDLEHGPMSIEFATTLAVAALDTGISPIVRVPFMQHTMATRVLDNGALGIVDRRHLWLARQCGFDIGRQFASFFRFAHLVAGLELGHYAFCKGLERLADMFVAIGAALLDKHDLVDAGLLVARQMRAQLVGGADAAAAGIVR